MCAPMSAPTPPARRRADQDRREWRARRRSPRSSFCAPPTRAVLRISAVIVRVAVLRLCVAFLVSLVFGLVATLARILLHILDNAFLLGLRQQLLRGADGVEDGEWRWRTTFDLDMDVECGRRACIVCRAARED